MSKVKITFCSWEIFFMCSNCKCSNVVRGLHEIEIITCRGCKAEWSVIAEPEVHKTEAQSNKELGF